MSLDLFNKCAECAREFSFDHEGGFLWGGLVFCEDCDPEATACYCSLCCPNGCCGCETCAEPCECQGVE